MVQHKSPSKIVIRRLPPDMTETELLNILSPLPPYNYFKFHPADPTLAPVHTSRAYINFPNFEDVIIFRDTFDGQIFEDNKGNDYPAFVEVATFSLIPREKSREDKHNDTIQLDPEFIEFKEKYEAEEGEVQQINVEAYLKEAAAKDEERKKAHSTPLIDFIRSKRDTKKKVRDDRRKDERKKRRDDERKAKRRQDQKEKFERKQNLIESKNQHFDGPKSEGPNKRLPRYSESNDLNDDGDNRSELKSAGPKGGRTAAREKRKKEAEERRKQKIAFEKSAKKPDSNTSSEPSTKPPGPSETAVLKEPKNKRYSKRKDVEAKVQE